MEIRNSYRNRGHWQNPVLVHPYLEFPREPNLVNIVQLSLQLLAGVSNGCCIPEAAVEDLSLVFTGFSDRVGIRVPEIVK